MILKLQYAYKKHLKHDLNSIALKHYIKNMITKDDELFLPSVFPAPGEI